MNATPRRHVAATFILPGRDVFEHPATKEHVFARRVIRWENGRLCIPISAAAPTAGHPYGEGGRPELHVDEGDTLAVVGRIETE